MTKPRSVRDARFQNGRYSGNAGHATRPPWFPEDVAADGETPGLKPGVIAKKPVAQLGVHGFSKHVAFIYKTPVLKTGILIKKQFA